MYTVLSISNLGCLPHVAEKYTSHAFDCTLLQLMCATLVITNVSADQTWIWLKQNIFKQLEIVKGARTLRPRIFCRVSVYAKLLVVQLSNLHKTLKRWTTSTHPKNHEERTNGSYFISSFRSETKNNKTQEPLVLAA